MSLNLIPNRLTHDGHCLGKTEAYNLYSFNKYFKWIYGIKIYEP
jgi:hypothetical protein